jgi:integrase
MAVLAECPYCKSKQSAKNKKCIGKIKGGIPCGADLDKAKRSKKVTYWISFRIPIGQDEEGKIIYKQRREPVGKSIEKARDADGKRRVQKREHRIFDMLPESKMTFQELTDWYLGLKTVKKIKSFTRIKQALNNFNQTFANMIVGNIKPVYLENYQEDREGQGRAAAAIDMEISIAKTMVIKAFDNDLVDGRVLKAFRSVKRKLKKGDNARKRTLSFDEYVQLIDKSPQHLKACIVIAYNEGMRIGELRLLKWLFVDKYKRLIKLPAKVTKEGRPKTIPINHHVQKTLDSLPRALRHDYVFTYRGQPIKTPGGLKKSFKTACKKAKVPCGQKTPNGIIFHDIRRTVKTNMLAAGIDKVHRDLILGHSLKGMDVHYMAPDEATLIEAMNKYTNWIDDQFQNVDQSVDQNEETVKASNG